MPDFPEELTLYQKKIQNWKDTAKYFHLQIEPLFAENQSLKHKFIQNNDYYKDICE